jgi:hypothetical protein
MTYIEKDDSKASQMMWDAGAERGGGPWVHCSCGIDHSVHEGEEDYEDSFDYIELNGQLFVYECDGCAKKLFKYEQFIWNNRDTIRRYLKIRIDQEKMWADHEKTLNVIAGIDDARS